jgi:hypothetical protein
MLFTPGQNWQILETHSDIISLSMIRILLFLVQSIDLHEICFSPDSEQHMCPKEYNEEIEISCS